MIPVQVLLVAAAVLAAIVVRPVLAGLSVRSEFLALRRLSRKDAAGLGLKITTIAPPLILACNTVAALLVPTVSLEVPADLPAVFGLLAAGRLLSALAAVEMGGAPGGTAASRAALFLAAAGPASVLAMLVVSGLGGSAGLPQALAAARDAPLSTLVPMTLAAAAVGVLGHADTACGGPEEFAGGRTCLVLRLAAAVRWVAWLDLVAVLLPPAPAVSFWPGLGLWAVKLAALAVLGTRFAGPFRPVAAPALAGLLGFLGAVLLALRSGAA